MEAKQKFRVPFDRGENVEELGIKGDAALC
jgi:hypothetical protein